MLARLEISNLVIIEKLSIEFASGFNVITGETGAGKSIMIKALQLILGAKATGSIVRNGAQSARVSALFSVRSNHPVVNFLENLDVEIGSDKITDILIRRTVSPKGRTQAWINDTLVTLSTLKKIGLSLIDIFGQNDSSRLLDATKHVHLLDQFVPENVKQKYFSDFDNFDQAFKELRSILSEYGKKSVQQDYLLYRCSELEKFVPDQHDYEALQERLLKLRNLTEHKKLLFKLGQILGGEQGIIRKLNQVDLQIPTAVSILPEIAENMEKIAELRHSVEDISFQVESWLTNVSESNHDQECIEERISQYKDFFRKTSTNNIQELLDYIEETKAELKRISFLEEEATNLCLKLPKLLDSLKKSSLKLTKSREKVATRISTEVASELEELAMAGASISVKFLPVRSCYFVENQEALKDSCREILADVSDSIQSLSSIGAEKPVIHLSANPGEPPRPLEKIASGGEVSRIMLSLKRVLASGGDACVLVFDEIDSGISGDVANKVGAKLKALSSSFQIICISHLAQVASYGDRHFKVSKSQISDRTYTEVTYLTDKQSTEELARLVSGEGITKASRDHAKILKEKAKNINY